MKQLFYALLLAAIVLASSCKNCEKKDNPSESQTETTVSDNQHLLMATAWYQKSAERDACYYQAFYMAELALQQNILDDKSQKPNAIVLDIDETLLDNSPFQAEMIFTGKPYDKTFWKEWTDLAKADALPGAIDFLNKAKQMGVEIFYISNRRTNELESTIKNMTALGFPELQENHFLLREDTSNKDARRAIVRENYDILLLVGDNLDDYSSFLGKREDNYGKTTLEANKEVFGRTFIILPNPMYGKWTKPLKKASGKTTNSEFISELPHLLNGFEN